MNAAGFVPVVPELFQNSGTPESEAGRAVPAVPVVPDEKEAGASAARIAAALQFPAAPTPAPAAVPAIRIERLRAHLLELADGENVERGLVDRLGDGDVLACDGLDASVLRAFLRSREADRQLSRGLVPVVWRGESTSICAGCGPVSLWPGAPARVQACPWCCNITQHP